MPQRERDPLLDNAKFLALVLVVVGHAWTDLRVVPQVEAAYTFVYLFHIPVFVLLAGHLSRSFEWTGRAIAKLSAALLIPYVLFETFYESLAGWAEGQPVHHNATAPSWVMWFLVSLFMWRLSVPVWRRLGCRLSVTVAVLVSLWGGISSSDDYAWSKTVGLLPFFVIGMFIRREHLDKLRTAPVRLAAMGTAVATAFACLIWAASFPIGLTRWKLSYAELGFGTVDGVVVRLVAIVAALLLSAVFIALVPGERCWYTAWGANTMYSYLLHGAVIQLAVAAGLYATGWAPTLGGAAVVTVLAAGTGVALMAPAIKPAFRPVVEPGPRRRVPAPSRPPSEVPPRERKPAAVAALEDLPVEAVQPLLVR